MLAPSQFSKQEPHTTLSPSPMASATVDSPSDRLQLESIATVDLRLLSQSELYALSLCPDGAFDPHRCDDVVIPKIDRSVFNESAGSRKQTYYRLRLAPRKPESSAAATATIPRLSPHLRIPKSASNTIDDTDPERAENSQIIGLLKELFAAETNGDDLVPIRVEYSDSVPQLPNVGNNVKKRKRGRPRKNENLSVVAAEAAEVVPVEVRAEGGDDVINNIIVNENVEDRDKEIVNKNGNVVDLAALASLEDPYGPELQRRTEDLKTEDELLGFLSGVNGQWGSRRKKKKIVDSSEFGDALPKGWKILLSLKKKEGRVWLFVRRYISPNGRQFVSCKEVSSYLLSFFGLEDVNQQNSGQRNENIQLTSKIGCGNSTDPAVKEINKRGNLVWYSPMTITYVSNDHEKQVTSEVQNSGEIQMGEILKCNKCTMTFDARDDLLHHQLSSHRRKRSRFGTSVTDGVIINGGQYECQFCHKTFNERNRYNGHVGAHIRHHMKSDEASPGVLSVQNVVGLVSSVGVPPKESTMQTSIGDDCDAVTFNAKADNELKPVSPQSKFKDGSDIEIYTDRSGNEVQFLSQDEQDSKFDRNGRNFSEEFGVKRDKNYEMNNCLGKVDEATHVIAAKFNFCLDSEALFDNGTTSNGETNILKCSSNRINDCPIGQGRSVESCPHSPFANEKMCGAEIDEKADSIRVEEPNREAGSESILLAPIGNEITCGIENMEDVHFTSPMERIKLDVEKFDNKLIHVFCSGAGPDEDDVTEGKQQNGSGGCSLVSVSNVQKCGNSNNVNAVSTFVLVESKQKRGTENIDEETCGFKDNVDRASTSSVSKPKLKEIYDSGNKDVTIDCGSGHSGREEDAVNRVEQKISESSLLVPSWKEHLCDIEDNGSAGSAGAGTMEEFGQEKGSEGSLLILSGFEQTCGVKNDGGNISTRIMEEPEHDDVQACGNNELALGISQGKLNTQHRSLEFCSLVLSGNEQTFNVEENVTGVCNSNPPKQDSSCDSGLLTQSCMGKTFGDVHIMNRVSTSSFEEPKPYKVPNSSNSELILDFGNNDAGIVADVINSVPMEQIFSFETNLSRENHSTGKDPKQESSLLGPSCFAKIRCDENNLSRVHTGRVWEGPVIDEVGSSGHHELTIAFGSSNAQLDGDFMAGGMWRTGGENVLQSPLADTSTQREQSSSCFPTFSIVSDKGEHELLRVNGKYDSMSGVEITDSGHTGHVEFNFLTTQNLNSLPGDSKALSYDPEMGQGFDSSFWIEKDALSLNIGARDQVTTVCVWCRNEFHHEPVHSGTQTGAIGSMCPTCSAKVSGQFNVF